MKESTAILLGSLIIATAILINGGIIKLGNLTKPTTTTTAPATPPAAAQPTVDLAKVKEVFNKSQIKFGNSNSKLVVLEVADPSCPYCHVAAGRNPDLNTKIGDRFKLVADGGSYIAPVPELEKLTKNSQIAFAYVYYPGHGNGEMGAKALYCANEKGKFWEVHDLIMNGTGYDLLNNTVKNDKTKSGELATFLQPAFNSADMKSCLDSGKYDNRLKEDMALATSLSIQGTPGFFLNDKQLDGAYSYTDMEATVKAALGS